MGARHGRTLIVVSLIGLALAGEANAANELAKDAIVHVGARGETLELHLQTRRCRVQPQGLAKLLQPLDGWKVTAWLAGEGEVKSVTALEGRIRARATLTRSQAFDSPGVGRVEPGETVEVLATGTRGSARWYQVRSRGRLGYVHESRRGTVLRIGVRPITSLSGEVEQLGTTVRLRVGSKSHPVLASPVRDLVALQQGRTVDVQVFVRRSGGIEVLRVKGRTSRAAELRASPESSRVTGKIPACEVWISAHGRLQGDLDYFRLTPTAGGPLGYVLEGNGDGPPLVSVGRP